VNPATILDLITARETTGNAHAEQLREQITILTGRLAAVETELADLATTRTTLIRLTGHTDTHQPIDATLASPAYQQILTVFATATSGLRAKDICRALGTDTTPNHTESLRAKLKRLVTRGILAETEPGVFTLTRPAEPATSTPHPTANP
jgi:hypothetical protein